MNDIERQLAQTWVIVLLEILPCVYESNVHGLSEGDIIIGAVFYKFIKNKALYR